MEGREQRALRVLGSFCFASIAGALVLIDRYSPATGYELSVYESVPPLTWICLIAALAGGTGVIVHQAFRGHRSRYWLLAFFLLMFSVSIILLLPAFRGYYLYGSADTEAHAMWGRHIAAEGHFWEGDNYPVVHILTAQLTQLSGIQPELVNAYVPVLFTLLFMLFSYLLARSVMPKKGQALLAAAASALFFNYYHVCVYPQGLSIMLLPMVFYLYFEGVRTASASFKVVFVAVLLWFPYSHPATAAAVIFSFLSAEVAKLLWRLRTGAQPAVASKGLDRITLEPTLISSVAFLTWISSYEIFGTTIRRSLGWLRGDISEVTHVQILEQTLEKQQLQILQQAELILKMYGDNLIYLLLSGIALLLIAWGWWRRHQEVNRLFTLSLPFLVSGPVWVLIFVTTLRVTVGRLLGANIMMWATPVLASFALFEMFGRWRRAGVVVVTSVLICTSVVGILGVYHSPYILQPSWQITHADVRGSNWFSDHREAETKTAVLGEVTALWMSLPMPDHFAYPQVEILGDLLGRDFYLLINTRFRVAPAHPILARTMLSHPGLASSGFSESDFVRLEKDRTVDEVYCNGGLDVMWINAVR